MNVLIDMNLSPALTEAFEQQGLTAVHWSDIGERNASDHAIMDWARTNRYVVLTRDLDFGHLLAVTNADGLSVIQLRGRDVAPGQIVGPVVTVMQRYELQLQEGALIVIDENSSRVRILPLIL